jgi:hypothetical protein
MIRADQRFNNCARRFAFAFLMLEEGVEEGGVEDDGVAEGGEGGCDGTLSVPVDDSETRGRWSERMLPEHWAFGRADDVDHEEWWGLIV